MVHNQPLNSFKLNSIASRAYNEERDCQTVFHKIKEYEFEDERSKHYTLLRCLPMQGRTHQIRIHLMQLGYPIVLDYLYNERDALSRYTPDISDMNNGISKIFDRYQFDPYDSNSTPLHSDNHRHETSNDTSTWSESLTSRIGTNVPFCLECTIGGYVGETIRDTDPKFMCLHSWKYEISSIKKCFEAKIPRWATDAAYIREMIINREKRIESRKNMLCHTSEGVIQNKLLAS